MTKILKTYMGVVTGSYMGRDDGQPQEKQVIYSDMARLARDFGTKTNEAYYSVEPVDVTPIVAAELEKIEQAKEVDQQNQADYLEYLRLKKKLNL